VGKGFKIEHSGAKHGEGAFWGPKAEAKALTKKKRRAQAKKVIKEEGK